jgi:RNA polymerase sigma-70 factor (ECF subfamily)
MLNDLQNGAVRPLVTIAEMMRACLESGDEAAWIAVVERLQPVIGNAIGRVVRRYGAAKPALVDDLTQVAYLRLCADNYRFLRQARAQRDEAILGLVENVATSVAVDHFRSRPAEMPEPVLAAPPTVLGGVEAHIAGNECARDRMIFDLYYRRRLSARDIASVPGIGLTQRGVEASIHRVTLSLRAALAKVEDTSSRPKILRRTRWERWKSVWIVASWRFPRVLRPRPGGGNSA